MNAKLKKQIKLIPLVFYGVGTILGAGIYVIISEVAISAGNQFPLAFIVASLLAVTAGLSYAELSSRFPKSAGEAVYVNQAFNNKMLNTFIGYAVALTGIISASTILKGFHGYLEVFYSVPQPLSISLMVIFLGLIAIKGVKESVAVVSIITLLEIFGLLLVIWFGLPYVDQLPVLIGEWQQTGLKSSILAGALLAFFAFVGFEDMVNMAEEVVDAPKNLPRAIIIAVIISTALYFIVSLVCAVALPLEDILASKAPLVLIVERNSSLSPKIMAGIALISIINGALVQMIMVSRMFYGMANLGVAPKFLGAISGKTHTPIFATLVTIALVWILAMSFPLGNLAKATSLVILVVFIFICAALIKIKMDKKFLKAPFSVPLFVPILGAISCLLFLGYSLL